LSARLRFTRGLAYTIGVLAPLGDTIRRWDTWQDFPPALLDDYLLGALLIAGAWATRKPSQRGLALLAAAWGFTCAIAYTSLALHWLAMQRGEIDPAPVPTEAVFAIKVVGSLLAVVGLVLTLADTPNKPAVPVSKSV